MTQASGPQVYAQVSALVPDIAVLYMSGYTGETILARGRARGGGGVPAEAVHAGDAGAARCGRCWTRRCGSRRRG